MCYFTFSFKFIIVDLYYQTNTNGKYPRSIIAMLVSTGCSKGVGELNSLPSEFSIDSKGGFDFEIN